MTRNQHHSAANSIECFALCKQLIKNCHSYSGVKQTSTLLVGTHQHHEPANKLPAPSWTSQLFPFKLGSTNTGSLDPSNCGWLPTGTYLHPPPNKSTTSNKMLTRKHGSNYHRGDRPDKKRGNYRDTSCPTELCLPNFSGGEKGWGPKACSEPEVPEPVCENRALQDGGSSPAPRPASSTGLDGEVRPEGCLPSGPNSLKPSTPPNLPVGGKELHVQMPTIWPVLSTQSVHQIAEASGGLLEANRLSSNNISGQHANLAPDHPVDLPVARGPRTYGQPVKVHNKPHSGVGISGLSGGININESVHSLRETAEDKARCEANVGLPSGDSEGSGTLCRESCSYTESHPSSSITLSSSPNVDEFCPSPELHTGGDEQEIRDTSDTDRSLQGRSNLVGFIGTEPPGNTSLPTMPYSDGALRCIQQGLGGSSQWANADRRSLVTGGSNSPYKLPGVVSSLPSNQGFREDLAGYHSINAHRQHCGSKLYKSERRHNLQAIVPAGFVNLDLVQRTKDLPPGRTCTRAAQYTSRRGIQDCERPMRLDAQPVNVSSNSDSNGGTGGGPVHITSDTPAASLLQLEARPRSRGHRCIYAACRGYANPPWWLSPCSNQTPERSQDHLNQDMHHSGMWVW